MTGAACTESRHTGPLSPEVSLVLVFAPALKKPYPLIAAEGYGFCTACGAAFEFVDKAVDSHPVTRNAGPWSKAVIVFIDGDGMELKPKRPEVAQA